MRRNLSHTVNHGLRELTTDLYVGFFNLNRLYTTPPFRRFPDGRNKRKCMRAGNANKKKDHKRRTREKERGQRKKEKEREWYRKKERRAGVKFNISVAFL